MSLCPRRFKKILAISPIIAALTFHAPIFAGNDGVILSHAVEEEVNRIADKLASALHTQESLFAGRDPNTLIDQALTRQLARQIEITEMQLSELPDEWEKALKLDTENSPEVQLEVHESHVRKKAYRASDRLGYLSIAGISLSSPVIAGLLMAPFSIDFGLIGMSVIVLSTSTWGLISSVDTTKQIEKQRSKSNKKLMAAVQEALFMRLKENGIDVPKKGREEWLLNRIEGGGVLAPWENLEKKDKLNFAREYAIFLENLAAVHGNISPEAREMLLTEARELSSAVDNARWYRFGSFRALRTGVIKAIHALNDLDKRHGILARSDLSVLNLNNRLTYDFPEIFTDKARAFMRQSRMDLPELIATYAPRIKELGGLIDLKVKSKSNPSQQNLDVTYEFTVTIPDTPEIKFSATLTDEASIRSTQGLTKLLPKLNEFEFRRQLSDSLVQVEFASEITSAHEAKFPEKACPHAFSTAGSELRKVVTELASEAYESAL